MSRSGYSYDHTEWELIIWRGAVLSALRGKRGQAFLREMREALTPLKSLTVGDLETPEGEVCALGAVGRLRGLDLMTVDPYDREGIAKTFGIAEAMAAEIMDENDSFRHEAPEARHARMLRWVESNIKETV